MIMIQDTSGLRLDARHSIVPRRRLEPRRQRRRLTLHRSRRLVACRNFSCARCPTTAAAPSQITCAAAIIIWNCGSARSSLNSRYGTTKNTNGGDRPASSSNSQFRSARGRDMALSGAKQHIPMRTQWPPRTKSVPKIVQVVARNVVLHAAEQ